MLHPPVPWFDIELIDAFIAFVHLPLDKSSLTSVYDSIRIIPKYTNTSLVCFHLLNPQAHNSKQIAYTF